MSNFTFEFIEIESGHTYPEDAVQFEGIWDGVESLDTLAVDAAEHLWNYCDGWESVWPLVLELYINGTSQGQFKINMEYSPYFSAAKCDP